MGRESVRKALDGRLATYTPALPIAWENTDYKPVTGQPYIAQTDLPATPSVYVGLNAPTKYIGTYYLRLFYPSGAGAGVAVRQADALVEHFKRGTPLSADGLPVYIQRTWRGAMQSRENTVFYPVNVEYFAYDFPAV